MTQAKNYPDTTKMDRIERNCYGRNRVNAYTIENLKHVLPQLEKLKGKKLKLSNGSKSAKFEITPFEVPYISEIGQTFRTYVHFQYRDCISLFTDITIKDRDYNGGGYGVTYYKTEVIIANVDENGVLTEVQSLESIVKFYSLDKVFNHLEVKDKMKQIEQMKDKLRQLQNEISDIEQY